MVKYMLFYKNMLINQMKQTVLELNKILYFISLLIVYSTKNQKQRHMISFLYFY